ncbi:hypothetical protein [Pedosphaera parvula]|uniref:Uncharacterized protein n=1 Tax=Pedosphaera parvula (strain Ellin514) TaxID=320771 RepID=B9XJW7_PEDPL|nr:hypothetical protein [Pedosphaera parvula]EEF59790.1 hypothetical protein Cflav_PD2797 [Pedosphaera parvula Ellin514]
MAESLPLIIFSSPFREINWRYVRQLNPIPFKLDTPWANSHLAFMVVLHNGA